MERELVLNNVLALPDIAFGTWQIPDGPSARPCDGGALPGRAHQGDRREQLPRHHLQALFSEAEIMPMVNQIEFHPGFRQAETVEFCREHGIQVEAWSPFGCGALLKNEELAWIAGRYGTTVAQLCLRWCRQHGVIPIPRSSNPERIRANFHVDGFEISPADMERIDRLENIGGFCHDPDKVNF